MRRVLLVGTNKFDALPALLARSDLEVQVLTEPWYAERYAAAGLEVGTVPSLDRLTDVEAWATRAHSTRPFDAIMAPSERSVTVAGFLRDLLGVDGMSFRSAVRHTSKHVMKSALASHGVPIAPYRHVVGLDAVPEAIEDLHGPVLIKATRGTGSTSCVEAQNVEEWFDVLARLPTALASASGIMVEARLDVREEFVLDSLHTPSGTVFTSVARYFDPLFPRHPGLPVGSIVLVNEPRRVEFLALQTACRAALGHASATHLEILVDATGQLFVGEMAARPGGGAIAQNIAYSHHVDMWAGLLALELGESPPSVPVPAPRPTAWFCLPTRPGLVRSVTSADRLRAVEGVIDAVVEVTPGDVLRGSNASSARVGHVVVDAVDASVVAARVLDLFELECDEVSR